MTRKEMKTATDSEIILDYIRSYANLSVNQNLGCGIERLSKHLEDLDEQMLKRGILNEDQIRRLNA